MDTRTQTVTVTADQVQAGDLIVGRGIVRDIRQTVHFVDFTYELTGTSSGFGTMSCRWDTHVKVVR